MSSLHQGFQQAGESGGTEAVFRWLDGADESPLIQQVKRRMLDICPVAAGDRVLDIGCGLGHEVRRLAQLVGPGAGRIATGTGRAGRVPRCLPAGARAMGGCSATPGWGVAWPAACLAVLGAGGTTGGFGTSGASSRSSCSWAGQNVQPASVMTW